MTTWTYLQLFSNGNSHPTDWTVEGDIELVIPDGASVVEALDAAGREGWELVALSADQNYDFYYLKRPS